MTVGVGINGFGRMGRLAMRAAWDWPELRFRILGYESRPLVSVDFKDDPRPGIVDGPSTQVADETQVKILAWCDNEWGYANRLVELARKVADSLSPERPRGVPATTTDG